VNGFVRMGEQKNIGIFVVRTCTTRTHVVYFNNIEEHECLT
jgi:hypothetical protein